MTHLDLFSGIGGFAYAIDQVYGNENTKHIFVENDPFCQEVFRKHWPEAEIHGDIREFVADTKRTRLERNARQMEGTTADTTRPDFRPDILTGGFPCQPFSQAGRRKGTADDRYLWPPMFECIALYHPRWVIAENVAGLVTWNDGLVLETVCTDLEKEGYEVQPFIIPACAVGAPHRRDRIWIVAHSISPRARSTHSNKIRASEQGRKEQNIGERSEVWSDIADSNLSSRSDAPDTNKRESRSRCEGYEGQINQEGQGARYSRRSQSPDWSTNWLEVATRLCRVDDGLPRRMDRNPRLKALGNAIVPAVAKEIIKAIKQVDETNNKTLPPLSERNQN